MPPNLRRLVQSLETRLFLAPEGKWTKDVNEALDFRSLVEALAVCEKVKLKNIAYGLTDDGNAFQFRFPILTAEVEPARSSALDQPPASSNPAAFNDQPG